MNKNLIFSFVGVILFIFIDTVVLDDLASCRVDRDVIKQELSLFFNSEIEPTHSVYGLSIQDIAYGDLHYFSMFDKPIENIEETALSLITRLEKNIDNICNVDLIQIEVKNSKGKLQKIEIRNCKVNVK